MDRFLVSDEWEAHFGGVVQSMMPRPISDHFLVLLEGGGLAESGPLPFRFENMWLKATVLRISSTNAGKVSK